MSSLLRIFDLLHHHYSTNNVPPNFKNIEDVYKSQTDLYIIILSYLYSLFDRRGLNVIQLDKTLLSHSSKGKLDDIKKLWQPLENPITRIRHNLGFHGGGLPEIKNGHNAAEQIEKNNLLPRILVLFEKLESFGKILEHELQNKSHGTKQ